MIKCKWCNVEFNNGLKLGGHQRWCKNNPNYDVYIEDSRKYNSGKILSKETRDKISISRTNYLIKNPDKVPYRLYHSSKISNPEKILKDLFEKNNIKGWVYNLPFSIYSLDFAFPDLKIDIEIDGATHLQDKVIKIDKKRDAILEQEGWKIIRFKASEIKNNVYLVFCKILENIKIEPNFEVVINKHIVEKKNLYENEIKEKIKAELKYNKEKRSRSIENNKSIITNSSIDFKKYGWKSKISRLTGIKHQHIVKWMKKNMNEFYLKIQN